MNSELVLCFRIEVFAEGNISSVSDERSDEGRNVPEVARSASFVSCIYSIIAEEFNLFNFYYVSTRPECMKETNDQTDMQSKHW